MAYVSRISVLGAVVVSVLALSACYTPTCDTALRLSTLTVDFSAFPDSGAGLEFEVDCPGKSSCSDAVPGLRFDAKTENEVSVLPEIQDIRVVVYKKGSSIVISEKSLNPVPWDPAHRPNTCTTPAKATLKL
ncbi:hypothetical protein [Paenarthrobacter ilicis]|uniref:hypothetical protein n=1 Tax=Paenarthrobacter ilicis TaxID=43665 RepID=UPI003869500E